MDYIIMYASELGRYFVFQRNSHGSLTNCGHFTTYVDAVKYRERMFTV